MNRRMPRGTSGGVGGRQGDPASYPILAFAQKTRPQSGNRPMEPVEPQGWGVC